jgi:hypothetical protein
MEPSDKIRVDRRWNEHLEGADKHLPFVIEEFGQSADSLDLLWNRKSIDIWQWPSTLISAHPSFFPRHEFETALSVVMRPFRSPSVVTAFK